MEDLRVHFAGSCAPRPGGGRAVKAGRFGLEAAGPVHLVERPAPKLEVGFSWAKAERTEWAVAKLVELGLDLLTPLVADRTIVRPDRDGAVRREGRLRKIAREAAMQSRRPFLPEIGTSQTVEDGPRTLTGIGHRAGRAGRQSDLARDSSRAGRSGRWLVRP